jgi:hypothetical protein
MYTVASDTTTEEATTSMTDESTTTFTITTVTSNNSANAIPLINIMKINMIMISFGTVTCKLFMS